MRIAKKSIIYFIKLGAILAIMLSAFANQTFAYGKNGSNANSCLALSQYYGPDGGRAWARNHGIAICSDIYGNQYQNQMQAQYQAQMQAQAQYQAQIQAQAQYQSQMQFQSQFQAQAGIRVQNHFSSGGRVFGSLTIGGTYRSGCICNGGGGKNGSGGKNGGGKNGQ